MAIEIVSFPIKNGGIFHSRPSGMSAIKKLSIRSVKPIKTTITTVYNQDLSLVSTYFGIYHIYIILYYIILYYIILYHIILYILYYIILYYIILYIYYIILYYIILYYIILYYISPLLDGYLPLAGHFINDMHLQAFIKWVALRKTYFRNIKCRYRKI